MLATSRDPNSTISQDLQDLGFTDYEARVYVALLAAAPATAYEISKNKGLPRPNVYSALEGLERKGAVQRASTEPVRYVPVSPKELLERISRTVNARCTSLRERLDNLKTVQQPEYVWNVSGNDEAHAKLDELIRGAKRHVWVKAHHASLEPHRAALEEAAARGIAVLLILFGDAAQIGAWKQITSAVVYSHEGNGTVVGLGRHLVTLTADFSVALIANLKEQSGSYTRSATVVNLAHSMIRHEVYLAEIFAAFGKQLERRFGPALLSLRRTYLPGDQARALERHFSQ